MAKAFVPPKLFELSQFNICYQPDKNSFGEASMIAFLTFENKDKSMKSTGRIPINFIINVKPKQDRPKFATFAVATIPTLPFNLSDSNEDGFEVKQLFTGINKRAAVIDSDDDVVGK